MDQGYILTGVLIICFTTIINIAMLCHTMIEITRIEGRNKK